MYTGGREKRGTDELSYVGEEGVRRYGLWGRG